MSDQKSMLSRILDEVKVAQSSTTTSTSHSSYVSGVFEEPAAPESKCLQSDVHADVATGTETTKQVG